MITHKYGQVKGGKAVIKDIWRAQSECSRERDTVFTVGLIMGT